MRPYNTIMLAIVIITMFRAQQKAHVDVGNSEYVEVTVASAERTLHALSKRPGFNCQGKVLQDYKMVRPIQLTLYTHYMLLYINKRGSCLQPQC